MNFGDFGNFLQFKDSIEFCYQNTRGPHSEPYSKRPAFCSSAAAPVSKSQAVCALAPSNSVDGACGGHGAAAKGKVVPPLRHRLNVKSSGDVSPNIPQMCQPDA